MDNKKFKYLEVIKYEGDNNTLIWKHPAEDFNTTSTLIVHESQEAVFFKNGQIADVFSAGRYVLKTENIPVLRRIMNLPTGGESTFHCEVYFVNKVERMALKWGTDSKISFIEPNYDFPMEIRANGEMSISIKDSAAFLVRLVGTESVLTSDGLVRYFRGILMTYLKSHLARTIREQKLNIFEIDSQLDILSETMLEKLIKPFSEYGIELKKFLISTIVRPEEDPAYRRLKEAQAKRYIDVFEEDTRRRVEITKATTEAEKTVIEAEALAEKRRREGYTYKDERQFNVAEKMAENESAGQFTNAGIRIGMIAGVGEAVGNTMTNIMGNTAGNTTSSDNEKKEEQNLQNMKKCHYCGAILHIGAKFCSECGESQNAVCPKCGEMLTAGAKFCSNCGQKM